MSAVRVIVDSEAGEPGDDFLRVSCRGDAETGIFTRIERVIGQMTRPDGTGSWRLRKLFDGVVGSEAAALALARAYAQHKGVPVVYAPRRDD
ncbi:MAG: hypothetical protein L6Q83_07540 [Gammaproteobacteria bacterium]|nr:hypothetical protein [Gammaproteobacteria bacterium]